MAALMNLPKGKMLDPDARVPTIRGAMMRLNQKLPRWMVTV